MQVQQVILEAALLDVKPGEENGFEAAFARAQSIIASMGGYVSRELQRCMENPSRYLLLVRWETLSDHTEGFRGSTEYQEWKRLLHHFYDPFPTVEHFELVEGGGTASAGCWKAALVCKRLMNATIVPLRLGHRSGDD